MNDHNQRWRALADQVINRRKELGMHTRADLIRASGLSEPTVRGIETANPRGVPRDGTGPKLSFALQWTADSVDRILAGGLPVPDPIHQDFDWTDEDVRIITPRAIKVLQERMTNAENQLSRLDALEAGLRAVATELRSLAERAMLPDDDEGQRPGESRTGQ